MLEEAQVRAMFDRIAGLYDRMNSVMTAGLHHAWRRRAADLARLSPGDRALDVATGTGDLALELAARVGPSGEVVASDFSEGMLARAAAKASAAGLGNVRVETANALALPYGDGEFAAATVGFGARNFSDLDGGLREMTRVVRPGGRVVVLEITTPTRPPLSTFFALWFDRLVPALGRVAGDAQAYSYLPSSVRRFPGPDELAQRMWAAGLVDISYMLTAGGIIALHAGTVAPAGNATAIAAREAAGGDLATPSAAGRADSTPAAGELPTESAAPADSGHTRSGTKTTRAGSSRGGSSSTGSFPTLRPPGGSPTSPSPARRGGQSSSWGSWRRGEGGSGAPPPESAPRSSEAEPASEGAPPSEGGPPPDGASPPDGAPSPEDGGA